MKYRIIALACVLPFFYTAPVLAEDNSDHVIKYRQYVMSSISDHYKAIKYLTAGKITQPEQWLPHIRSLNDMAKMVEGGFPEGSDFGETDAKEAIWENKDDFNQKAQELVKVSDAMLKLIQSNDREGVKKQVTEIGQSCKSCHKKYREK